MATISRARPPAGNGGKSGTGSRTASPVASAGYHEARRVGVGGEGRDLQGRGRLCVTGARPGDGRRSIGRMVGPAGTNTLAVLLPHHLVHLRQARRTRVGPRPGE